MLTFVIPAAPYHEAIVREAVASVERQTLRCAVVVVVDHHQRGPAWARNEGLRQVTTPFVAFLDADDLLEPTFAEKTLRAYDGRRYIYTGWFADRVIQAPCKPWSGNGESHIITALLPTAWVQHIGGFREGIQAEDTEFFWKLTRSGLCGKRLDEPLVQYRKGGKRAQALRDDPNREAILKHAIEAYERLSMSCDGCGANADTIAAEQSGDVLATALWNGTRTERGRATGRLYRGGWNETLWVDPRDIDAAPWLFARVLELPPKPTETDFQTWARKALNVREAPPVEVVPEVYGAAGVVRPNVRKLLGLYEAAH